MVASQIDAFLQFGALLNHSNEKEIETGGKDDKSYPKEQSDEGHNDVKCDKEATKIIHTFSPATAFPDASR